MHHFNENLSIEFTHVFLFSLSPFVLYACVCHRWFDLSLPMLHATMAELIGSKWCCTIAKCSSLWLHYTGKCVFCYLRLTMQWNLFCFFSISWTRKYCGMESRLKSQNQRMSFFSANRTHIMICLFKAKFIPTCSTKTVSLILYRSLFLAQGRCEENGSFLGFANLPMRIRYPKYTNNTHVRAFKFEFVPMFCDVLPQPISNRFIYHTDSILLPFLLFIVQLFKLFVVIGLQQSISRCLVFRANEWQLVALASTSNYSNVDSQSATNTQTLPMPTVVVSVLARIFVHLFWFSFLSMLLKNGIYSTPHQLKLNFLLLYALAFRISHFASHVGLSLWEVFRKLIY